jgi:Tol biopolymer transport system component
MADTSLLCPRHLARALVLALVVHVSSPALSAQPQALGAFAQHQDVGTSRLAGTATYDATTQTYTLSSTGSNAGAAPDQFHLAWTKLQGDFIIQASVRFVGSPLPRHQLGLMVRDSLASSSRYAAATVHGDTRTGLQYRAGAAAGQVEVSSFHPTDIQLARTGDTFTFSSAVFGEGYKSISHDVALADDVHVGLFVASYDANVVAQAVFSNVRVIIPAAPGFKPYSDYLGSHLEVLEIATGQRKILHSEPGSIQAPNWTRDGKLIYNSAAGVMYTYDIATGTARELETGNCRQNNNDHVLSFDGKMLALSNYAGQPRRSVAYILPVTGSDHPQQITSPEAGHTYLHGWSPDGKKLVFTGGRRGETGEYRNLWSVDIQSKIETALTPPGTLDDGPEYTPDGKYIYFNSLRTGTMQIWRMRPDGSSPEQVTFDEYNDWFPHISPDGKWLVYIAFPADMNPWSHPFYRQCYIRLMPTSGGAPKTIGYIYGGQGSMNTPGWSPDSKRIAFVSNSKL